MEYIHLTGAETVQTAGHQMQRAAEEMKRAAIEFQGSVDDLKRFLSEWLITLEQVMNEAKP